MSSEVLAAWQATIYLIASGATWPDISQDGWQPPQLSGRKLLAAHEMVASYLGSPWEIADNWFVFGPEAGSRIDVIFASGSIATIAIRFDVRNASLQFQELVCRLARELGCELFSAELNAVIQPDWRPLQMALSEVSSATCGSPLLE